LLPAFDDKQTRRCFLSKQGVPPKKPYRKQIAAENRAKAATTAVQAHP
jgi:hypothetical protein